MSDLIKGAIDMHIHSAPDIRKRKMNDIEIMEESIKLGIRAVVIKSHDFPTVTRARLVNLIKAENYEGNNFQMFGGIALNNTVGGLNPYAVEATLKLGGKVVWLPTKSARNNLEKSSTKFDESEVVDVITNQNKLDENLYKIFNLIKEYDAVLATGHLNTEEIFQVVSEAKNAGVKKIVVTHPEFHIIGMGLEDQKKLIDSYEVFMERVFAQPIGGGNYKINIENNIKAIQTLGADNTIISTDSGQMQNPKWCETIVNYIKSLQVGGLSEGDINIMTKINPGKLLGLEEYL